jgi:D-3-phosphoglycerate dehydrogenase
MKQGKQVLIIFEHETFCEGILNQLTMQFEIFFAKNLEDIPVEILKTCVGILTKLKYYLGKHFLTNCPSLRFVATPTTGLTHLDLDYCQVKNIRVFSLKGQIEILDTINSTAEHAFGILLSCIRNIHSSTLDVINGNWNRNKFIGIELSNKKFGIIGYGRLGRKVAKYADAFGCQIFICEQRNLQNIPYKVCKSIYQLAKKCDIVSIHVDYRTENHHIINRKFFSCMKESAYFINTSRGELVDEEALYDAINNNSIAGAAIDVIESEQTQTNYLDHKLIQLAAKKRNLLITPHIGGITVDAKNKVDQFIVSKIIEHHEIL